MQPVSSLRTDSWTFPPPSRRWLTLKYFANYTRFIWSYLPIFSFLYTIPLTYMLLSQANKNGGNHHSRSLLSFSLHKRWYQPEWAEQHSQEGYMYVWSHGELIHESLAEEILAGGLLVSLLLLWCVLSIVHLLLLMRLLLRLHDVGRWDVIHLCAELVSILLVYLLFQSRHLLAEFIVVHVLVRHLLWRGIKE